MVYNKYLEDIGIDARNYATNFVSDDDDRNEIWQKEKEEWGFDSRETWCMDRIFIEWLYCHLMLFQEYYQDTGRQIVIPFINPKESYTISEWISMIKKACISYLKTPMWSDDFLEKMNLDALEEAVKVFAEILIHLSLHKEIPDEKTLENQRKLQRTLQRTLYGFDETEIYHLYYEFPKWLYSHLEMFNEVNTIATDRDMLFYQGQQICMQDVIDSLMEKLKNYLDNFSNPINPSSKEYLEMKEALFMWSETFYAFWW